MLYDHNGIKLEMNNRKFSGKSPNIWKLTNGPLHNLRGKKKQKEMKVKKKKKVSKEWYRA